MGKMGKRTRCRAAIPAGSTRQKMPDFCGWKVSVNHRGLTSAAAWRLLDLEGVRHAATGALNGGQEKAG
jgi:hypothetical protein